MSVALLGWAALLPCLGPLPAPAQEPAPATRFSTLAEIGAAEVSALKPVLTFRTGNPRGHSGAPALAGDLLLVPTPFPHALHALSLAKGGEERWADRPDADTMAEGLATSGAMGGGLAVEGALGYLSTLDGRVAALDAATGRRLWTTRVVDPERGQTISAAPLVAAGKIFVGVGGDDFGARGFLVALDAETGGELWRRYSTGPDADVGIGPGFEPTSRRLKGVDLGVRTWPPSGWEIGGGGVSGPLLHDPAAGLVFHGTGHPAPWTPDQRPGDNLWTSGLFARDVETGAARWFVQLHPHDPQAYGATGPSLLIDRDWRGAPRKLLVHPGANGFIYVLDRLTGEVLSAEPYVSANATRSVELGTGEPRRDGAKSPRVQVMARDVCPAWTGAAVGASAYSPETGLLYVPASHLCMDIEARDANFAKGTPYMGANVRLKPPREGPAGALVAWDLAAGKRAWSVPERFPLGGGVLATAGGLVLYGTLDGLLKAVDARTGRTLWSFQASSGIVGDPTTFKGPDGRQHIAVLAGLGGPLGRAARKEWDLRDATAVGGAANALRDLPQPADESGTLYVFRLP